MTDLRISHDDSYTHEETSFPLFGLPLEIREKIYSYCSSTTLGFFAHTSYQDMQETVLFKLLSCAVYAEPDAYNQRVDTSRLAAFTILKKHPELLFQTRQITDHFDRRIEGSPYRIFLGAGDIWALKRVHIEIIPEIENGGALAKAEFQVQFPDYKGPWPLDPNMLEEVLYDERNKAQIAQVKAQLESIVKKITADPCTNGQATKDETTKAVADLCEIFAPKEGEVIATGLHFPLGIMKEIEKVYDAQFDLWSDDQLVFFSREVTGGTLAVLTAIDGQCVKKGLSTLKMEEGPDRGDGLFCCHPIGIPMDKAPLVGKLGRTMFVDPYDGYSCFISSTPGMFDWYNKNGRSGCGRAGVAALRSKRGVWEKLWRTKAETIASYYPIQRTEVAASVTLRPLWCASFLA